LRMMPFKVPFERASKEPAVLGVAELIKTN
jgi:hypothetical protein